MTQSEKQKWEKIRAKGRTRYILVEGILRRGILCGVIFAIFPYEFGIAFHAFTMPVWALLALSIFLSLIFGVGLGALLWNLAEKNYQIPITDDHNPNLPTLTKAEFSNISRTIGKRQAYRRLSALSVLVFVFAGLSILPRSSPYRNYYVWGIIIGAWTLFIIVFRFIIRGTKNDCYELGAICPKCNKPLYSGSSVRNGRCPNCGYQIFEYP